MHISQASIKQTESCDARSIHVGSKCHENKKKIVKRPKIHVKL